MSEDFGERVGDEYLRLAGLEGLVTKIHPDDEMLANVRHHARRPESVRLEYFSSGHAGLLSIDYYLAAMGRSLDGLDRVLDFACGCGRLTRFLTHRLSGARVWASDLDRAAVDFVRETFGAQTFYSCTDPDHLTIPGRFDLIFVGSLFTHLPRASFGRWLAKLYGALAPDGSLVFSTHGCDVVPEVTKDPCGYTYVRRSETSRLDADEYGSMFVAAELVQEIAAAAGVLDLHGFAQDLWHIQDLWIARSRPTPKLDGLPGTPTVYGAIETADFASPDRARIGGFVKVRRGVPPVTEVRLLVDGVDVVGATLGAVCSDAANPAEIRFCYTPWWVEGNADVLTPGPHVIAAVGVTERGRRQCFDALVQAR